MTNQLYNNTDPQTYQTCQPVQVLSQRVDIGTWPAAIRAVIKCGSSTKVFENAKGRAIIQWAVRVNDSTPNRLLGISQYVTLDQSIMTVDGIGSVCCGLFGAVPEHLNDLEMVGRTCQITVGLNGYQKNRVIGHSPLPIGKSPVRLSPELLVTGDICDMDAVLFGELDLPPSMRNARMLIAKERGLL